MGCAERVPSPRNINTISPLDKVARMAAQERAIRRKASRDTRNIRFPARSSSISYIATQKVARKATRPSTLHEDNKPRDIQESTEDIVIGVDIAELRHGDGKPALKQSESNGPHSFEFSNYSGDESSAKQAVAVAIPAIFQKAKEIWIWSCCVKDLGDRDKAIKSNVKAPVARNEAHLSVGLGIRGVAIPDSQ
ncbi:hypothetical protein MMC28_000413 [Mycoblastus sanguinarius]|nr:hypothetical protein [Mycoblastus sanguinarius]